MSGLNKDDQGLVNKIGKSAWYNVDIKTKAAHLHNIKMDDTISKNKQTMRSI